MRTKNKVIGVALIAIVVASFAYYSFKGSEVMGAFNTGLGIPVLNVAQGTLSTDPLTSGSAVYKDILNFTLSPSGTASDGSLYLHQLAFAITPTNLLNNFNDVSSWQLKSDTCNELVGIETAEYSSGILVLSLDGSGCKSELDAASESITLNGENTFTLKLKASVSDKTKKAGITTKIVDTVDDPIAIWEWSNSDLWSVSRAGEIYSSVNGTANATVDLTIKK